VSLHDQLEIDEGKKPYPYKDREGYWTVGVGRLIDSTKDGGLSADEILFLLGDGNRKRYANSKRYPYQEAPEFWNVPLTEDEIQYLLTNDIQDKMADCYKVFKNFGSLSPARQDALTNLMFNLGIGHISSYHTLIAQVTEEDWPAVQENMRGWLKWKRQVGPRADRIINALG
jgi:GH24 family phage-related lysozyme (muramidase)